MPLIRLVYYVFYWHVVGTKVFDSISNKETVRYWLPICTYTCV